MELRKEFIYHDDDISTTMHVCMHINIGWNALNKTEAKYPSQFGPNEQHNNSHSHTTRPVFVVSLICNIMHPMNGWGKRPISGLPTDRGEMVGKK